jgi:hypothetical protein
MASIGSRSATMLGRFSIPVFVLAFAVCRLALAGTARPVVAPLRNPAASLARFLASLIGLGRP